MTADEVAGPAYGIPPPGHRLPAVTRPGPVRLQVADLAWSLRVYEGMLGFAVRDRTAGSATLTARDDATPLVELHEHPGARPVPRSGRLGLYHFAILLPDRPSLGRLLRHLAGLGVRPGSADHLVSEALYLYDPDGLGIEIYADRPRASWERHEGQIEMATEPLDERGLLDQAGPDAWQGIPAGSVMGHVHLQVGSLDTAAALYEIGLGLERTVWDYPGALFLSAGGYHHHLGLNTWAGASAPRPTDADARLLEWQLVVPVQAEVDVAATRVERSGHRVRRDGADTLVTDPWGTVLRLRCDTLPPGEA